jgi:hypothetical protein
MDEFEQLLNKIDALQATLNENEIRIQKTLDLARELQAQLLEQEIQEYLNDETD